MADARLAAVCRLTVMAAREFWLIPEQTGGLRDVTTVGVAPS